MVKVIRTDYFVNRTWDWVGFWKESLKHWWQEVDSW